jgi:hypothetical protein
VLRIRIRDEQPGSYFLELRNFFWVKILKVFDADPIRDGKNSDLGWKKVGSGVRDINIPDSQHCLSVVIFKRK